MLLELTPFGLLAALLLWARFDRVSNAPMGLAAAGWLPGLAWGVLAGLGMAAPALAFFAFPVVMSEQVAYAGYQHLEWGALAAVVFLRIPLRTALVEEIVFRGLLQARAIAVLGARGGLALTCTVFVLWHSVITYNTLALTNLSASPLPLPLLWIAAAIPLGVAGLIFSWLRLKTGSLAAPIAAHWTVSSCMAVFLAVSS